MTLAEFKAWFEGFTETMVGPPSAKAWERIQERVKEITGQAVSYPVYVDRYMPLARPYWGSLQGQAISSAAGQAYNSCVAMNALGQAEALSMKAA